MSLFRENDLLLFRMKEERNSLILAVPSKHALRVRNLFKHCMRHSKDCRMEVNSSDAQLIGVNINNCIVVTAVSKSLRLIKTLQNVTCLNSVFL